jgi:KEOPS complex subunit Cgi121
MDVMNRMLMQIEEYGVYAEITGFRGIQIDNTRRIADLTNQEKRRNTTVQFFDAQCIATWKHLYFAVLDALLGFKNNLNISRSLGVEIMLYASAQRQIRKAIDLIGVKPGCLDLAVVIVDENQAAIKRSLSTIIECIGKALDESVLGLSGTKEREIQRIYGISETEIRAATSVSENGAWLNLVIERMALLATQL